jgi:hypothetical protein
MKFVVDKWISTKLNRIKSNNDKNRQNNNDNSDDKATPNEVKVLSNESLNNDFLLEQKLTSEQTIFLSSSELESDHSSCSNESLKKVPPNTSQNDTPIPIEIVNSKNSDNYKKKIKKHRFKPFKLNVS